MTRTTEAANRKVIMLAISSPWRRRARNEREPATGPALGTVVDVDATLVLELLNFADGFHFLANDFLRQLGIGQRLRVVLTVLQRPFDEALNRVALGCV